MMADTFTCEQCGLTFEKEWTDEEANAEAKEAFGVDSASDSPNMAIACDDCYAEILKRALRDLRVREFPK